MQRARTHTPWRCNFAAPRYRRALSTPPAARRPRAARAPDGSGGSTSDSDSNSTSDSDSDLVCAAAAAMEEETRRQLVAAYGRARTLPLRDDSLWRSRPFRVLDVVDGDTLILWASLERIPAPDADGHYHDAISHALRTGDGVVVTLQDVRSPKLKQPGGRAAHDILRRVARRGARVWLVGAAPYSTDRVPGRTLQCRTLRVEIADQRTLAVEEALLRCGAAYHYPVSSHSAATTLLLADLEDEARRARLGVWAQGRGGTAERPWDYARRMREQGRRSPSPRSRYAGAARFVGAAGVQP